MNKNLPQKYKNSFFRKLFYKIKFMFFGKKQIENASIQIDNTIKESDIQVKKDFIEQVKVDENIKDTESEKREFMKKLTDNPKLLEEFSSDRLEKILQYYLEENEKKRELLKKLSA